MINLLKNLMQSGYSIAFIPSALSDKCTVELSIDGKTISAEKDFPHFNYEELDNLLSNMAKELNK